MSYRILTNLAAARNHSYTLVIKTRPDLIYITPLYLRDLIANKHYLDRPFFNEKNLLADVHSTLKGRVPKIHVLHPYGTSVYFPPCAGFGGVTDRFFIGPPAYMDVILDSEWLKDWLTADKTAVDSSRPSLVKFKSYTRLTGVEGYLMLWLIWNSIPVAELPARDMEFTVTNRDSSRARNTSTLFSHEDDYERSTVDSTSRVRHESEVPATSRIKGFVWMIIRLNQVALYCNEASFDQLHWTDSHCTFESGANRSLIIKRYFFDNKKPVKEVCDKHRYLYEPVKILSHRKCAVTQKIELDELTKCEFHVLWSDGETTWDQFKTLSGSKQIIEYLSPNKAAAR
jgi:hypothetical protein